MKCLDDEMLAAYLDGEGSSQERSQVASHLLNCQKCRQLKEEWEKESQAFHRFVSEPSLPDSFVAEVRAEIEKIQVRAKEQPVHTGQKSKIKKAVRIVSAAVASLVLLTGAAAWASPTFASYLGLRFQDFGFSVPANVENKNEHKKGFSVTDQGVTLRVTEVMANPTEVYFMYQIEKSGKLLNMEEAGDPMYSPTVQAFLKDDKGNMINTSETGSFRNGGTVGVTVLNGFSLDELAKVTLEVKIPKLKGMDGHWLLKIPLNMSKAQINQHKVNQTFMTPDHKFAFTLKEVTYTSTATEIKNELKMTDSEWEKQKNKLNEREEPSIFFTIVDEKGRIISGNEYDDKYPSKFKSGRWDGGARQQKFEWSFAPFPKKKLSLVLHSVETLVLSDQEFTYKPGETGSVFKVGTSTYRFKGAKLGLHPSYKNVDDNRKYLIIDVDKEPQTNDKPLHLNSKQSEWIWMATDETGKKYESTYDRKTGQFVISDMHHLPNELKLKPYVVQSYQYDLKIPLPEQK